MKDPSFPLYARDWLTATRTMTAAARGAYIDLLCYQWLEGFLPEDQDKLRRVCALDREEFLTIWPEIEPHFPKNCVGIVNNRLERVRAEREAFCRKQSENGRKGGRPKANENPNKTQTITQTESQTKPKQKLASASASASSIASAKTPFSSPKGDFDAFWSEYPRRKGSNPKQPARVSYERSLRTATHEEIMRGLTAYKQSDPGERGAEFIAQAATWLNQRRWEDDYSVVDERAKILAQLGGEA